MSRKQFLGLLQQNIRMRLRRIKLDVMFFFRRLNHFRLELIARKNVRHRPLRVIFLVNEINKWKVQTLLTAFQKDIHFEPHIVLTRADRDIEMDAEAYRAKASDLAQYFRNKASRVEWAYLQDEDRYLPLSDFNPDIVFYQQPWDIAEIQHPRTVDRYALTCYVPYYVPNYGSVAVECQPDFHAYLWRYYLLNQKWCDSFGDAIDHFQFLPKLVASGHPMLDNFISMRRNLAEDDQYVIYAPHWSFPSERNPNFENYSTFLTSGSVILKYAQLHPEIKWAFRPHPTLRHVLVKSGEWTPAEVDAYYASWEKIGIASYNGDYVDLFENSRALITDCASFLVEYACTGNPIIQLVCSKRLLEPMEPSRLLFASYYQAHNLDEMFSYFETILERGQDPRRAERINAVRDSGLLDVRATENIMNDLRANLRLHS